MKGSRATNNVRLAIEAGFRHIDTAQGYDKEEAVGQGIIVSGIDCKELLLQQKSLQQQCMKVGIECATRKRKVCES